MLNEPIVTVAPPRIFQMWLAACMFPFASAPRALTNARLAAERRSTNFGTAIAARQATMKTTEMSSTRVNPLGLDLARDEGSLACFGYRLVTSGLEALPDASRRSLACALGRAAPATPDAASIQCWEGPPRRGGTSERVTSLTPALVTTVGAASFPT